MGGKNDGSDAANESNQLLREQLEREKREERLKVHALQQEEFDVVSEASGGNFSGRKPTQSDYPIDDNDHTDDKHKWPFPFGNSPV